MFSLVRVEKKEQLSLIIGLLLTGHLNSHFPHSNRREMTVSYPKLCALGKEILSNININLSSTSFLSLQRR